MEKSNYKSPPTEGPCDNTDPASVIVPLASIATQLPVVPDLFSYRKYWPYKFGPAPILPMSRTEMDELGWDSCDIIIITGDAYVDHPSFGMAVMGRLLEAQGFRVGIIAQPDWDSTSDIARLGKPNLFFGITAGNMDSMVNHYTSDRKPRSDDAYTPDSKARQRPDRAVTVYSHLVREAFAEIPLVIGGIEASLRRVAHYDYWDENVHQSILPESKADLLLFGNAERAIVEVAHRLAAGEHIGTIRDLRGSAFIRKDIPQGWTVLDSSKIDTGNTTVAARSNPYAMANVRPCEGENKGAMRIVRMNQRPRDLERNKTVIRLPSYEQIKNNKILYAHSSRVFHLETNPGNARALVQLHGKQNVWLNPPPIPLTSDELDSVYELPFTRNPHLAYGNAKNPAWEMIRFSVNIMRGCFGGCTFCSITEHEGRIIQSRSEDSIVREVEMIRDTVKGFTGNISDLGGPTANMYRLQCKDPKIESSCRRLSCVYPGICSNLNTDHKPLTRLYRRVRGITGIKRVFIASGLRYDLAVQDPEYVKVLVTHHVGGYLKIAPEHTQSGPLSKMMKPGIASYDRFKEMFEKFSKQAGKQQYLIPYFISAHPGTSNEDMLQLALWLKRNNFRLDQVQAFLPTPLALATAMYHSGKNPLKKVNKESEQIEVIRDARQRRLHKAFLRYHDPENWPLIRESLRQMGKAYLIGNGKKHLLPSWQPKNSKAGVGKFRNGHKAMNQTKSFARPTKPGLRSSTTRVNRKK